MRAAALECVAAHAAQELVADALPAPAPVDPEARHEDGRRAVVTVARERVPDSVAVWLPVLRHWETVNGRMS